MYITADCTLAVFRNLEDPFYVTTGFAVCISLYILLD
jgi:hypothetical protein